MDKKAFKAIEKGNIADLKKVLNSTTINLPDKKGETLLHHSARAGHLDICKLLVQTGCDPKLRNIKGQTAADVVDIKKKKGVATWLKEQEINVSSWLTSLSSNANIYFYENENWKSIVSGGILEILHNSPLFAFKLLCKDSSHSVHLDSLLDKDLLYSKATDTFHNFRSTSGDIWGFEFTGGVSSADQFFIAIEEIKEKLKNPPAQNNISSGGLLTTTQQQTPTTNNNNINNNIINNNNNNNSPPQPPSNNNLNNNLNNNNQGGSIPQAPPAPVGGGPPPPPPPPSAPPSQKGGLSLAEQLALKKEKGLTAKPEGESDQHSDHHSDHDNNNDKQSAAPIGGGGGGNIMSELANRLKRRQTLDSNTNKQLEVAKETTEENSVGGGATTAAPPANKPIKQTPIAPSTPLKKSVAHPPSSSSSSSASSVASAGGIKKEELAELKVAMIESFRAELQDIKVSLISSLRAEIQQAYSK